MLQDIVPFHHNNAERLDTSLKGDTFLQFHKPSLGFQVQLQSFTSDSIASSTHSNFCRSKYLTSCMQISSGQGTSGYRREKSGDRFIPQTKVSSNYYSLLLSEKKSTRKKETLPQLESELDIDGSIQQDQSIPQDLLLNSTESPTQQQITYHSNSSNQQQDGYINMLRNNILQDQKNSNFNSFSKSIPTTASTVLKSPKVLSYNNSRMSISKRHELFAQSEDIEFCTDYQENRKISCKPYKILDAPGLSGDFYTNILDWTTQNLVVVALHNQIYTWSPIRHDVNNLTVSQTISPYKIVSLSSNRDGKTLATANEDGYVKIFDIEKAKIVYEYQAHEDRIGALAWNDNLLTTASKDSTIKMKDIRSKANLQVLNFHKEQVCGIKWSEDGVNLASGGNDNKVCVYNHKMNKLTSVFTAHSGAVKALAWSPHKQNVLVSGGGNKDQTLKFWNTQTNSLIKSIHTGSQVCNMVFSKHHNEVVTTHGFQLNQVSVWRADNYSQVATLYGHSERVLYLAQSPDNEDIVTGSADETLRFWKVFNSKKKKRSEFYESSSLDPIFSTIR